MITIDCSNITKVLKDVFSKAETDFPAFASRTMTKKAKSHLSNRFPSSKHWDTNKVVDLGNGITSIDIPGASRAYHDVDIYPVNASWLCFVVENQFVKTKHVHQQQDPTILPQMDEFKDDIVQHLDDLFKK